jgi:integrase
MNMPAQSVRSHAVSHSPELSTPDEFTRACAEGSRRLAAAGTPTTQEVAPPSAIASLSSASHPVIRYYRNRNALPNSMRSLRGKVRMTRRLLIEAGLDPAYAEADDLTFPWHCVDLRIATRFWEIVTDRYGQKSRENLLGVARQMLRGCATAGLFSIGHRDELLGCLPVRAGKQRRPGRALTVDEMSKLLKAARERGGTLGARDAALFATFLCTGVRVSEVVAIDVADVDLDQRCITIRRTKGGCSGEHHVFLHESTISYLEPWLAVRGDHPGALFDSKQFPGRGISTCIVSEVLEMAAKRAGIKQHVTTHDFRRTFITSCLRQDTDPFTVARLVGHKRVTTTMAYDRRTEEEDRQAVERLEIPSFFAGRQK